MAHFWSIFSIFGAKKFCLENSALSRTTSHRFLAPCQNLEKTNDTFQRKRPHRLNGGMTDGRKDGRKHGQTLFHRKFPATAGGPIKSERKCWKTSFWPQFGPVKP